MAKRPGWRVKDQAKKMFADQTKGLKGGVVADLGVQTNNQEGSARKGQKFHQYSKNGVINNVYRDESTGKETVVTVKGKKAPSAKTQQTRFSAAAQAPSALPAAKKTPPTGPSPHVKKLAQKWGVKVSEVKTNQTDNANAGEHYIEKMVKDKKGRKRKQHLYASGKKVTF